MGHCFPKMLQARSCDTRDAILHLLILDGDNYIMRWFSRGVAKAIVGMTIRRSFLTPVTKIRSLNQLGLCVAAIAVCQVVQTVSASAQDRESQLVQAMRGLAVTWQNLSQTQTVLVIDCLKGGFIGDRLISGAQVSVDLQKTASLMNPYLGIVNLTGRFENNADPYDRSCLPSKKEALQSDDWHGNDMIFNFQIYYQINGSEFWLMSGNTFFQNAFLRQPGPPEVEAGTDWHRAFRYPISAATQQ